MIATCQFYKVKETSTAAWLKTVAHILTKKTLNSHESPHDKTKASIKQTKRLTQIWEQARPRWHINTHKNYIQIQKAHNNKFPNNRKV